MKKTQYGLQMYSLRDITKDSMRMALEKIAEMGYKYVEFAGFFDYLPEQIKLWLDEFNLVCSGTHTGIDAISPEKIDEVIKYHKIIGCDNLIVPACDWSTPEKANEVINQFNFAYKKLKENGIRLGYHNHSREFLPDSNGLVFEDMLIKETQLELEVDTWWLFNTGIEVIPFLEKFKERIKVIHLKDGFQSAPDCKNYDRIYENVKGVSIGSGENNIKVIRDWAVKNDILMVVESEGLQPTGLEEVERCIKYLHTLD